MVGLHFITQCRDVPVNHAKLIEQKKTQDRQMTGFEITNNDEKVTFRNTWLIISILEMPVSGKSTDCRL